MVILFLISTYISSKLPKPVAQLVKLLVLEVWWLNSRNRSSDDRHRIDVSTHYVASTDDQTTRIVTLVTASRLVSPIIVLPSLVTEPPK